MSDAAPRRAYVLVLGGAMAAVAVLRSDLLLRYAADSARQFQGGGWPAWKIVLENLLLLGILGATLWVAPRRAAPARDAAAAVLALAAGWLAEAWGTRTGLWTYYTGETPPLWIVPAWSLGALVVDRAAGELEAALGPRTGPGAARAAWRAAAAAVGGALALFALPRLGALPALACGAALGAALAARPDLPRDLWTLAAGALCVVVADFWGVTNNCWRYHLQMTRSPAAQAAGIAFGALFDAAVIVLCLRAARRLTPGGDRS